MSIESKLVRNSGLPPVAESGTLDHRVAAVRLEGHADRPGCLGPLQRLEPGTSFRVCGAGYSEKTIKIVTDTGYFFVFSEDLGSISEN